MSGSRVSLRALKTPDWETWRSVRIASRDWLEPWEPLGEPGTPDPVTDPEAVKARCGAWERQRHFDAAYGFGIFVGKGATFVGEVSLGSVQRGPFQSANVGYWIGAEYAGQGYMPEAVAVILRFAFEELRLHRVEAAIVPRNGAPAPTGRSRSPRGSPRSSGCATRARPCGSSRSAACGRTTSATGSPPTSGRPDATSSKLRSWPAAEAQRRRAARRSATQPRLNDAD